MAHTCDLHIGWLACNNPGTACVSMWISLSSFGLVSQGLSKQSLGVLHEAVYGCRSLDRALYACPEYFKICFLKSRLNLKSEYRHTCNQCLIKSSVSYGMSNTFEVLCKASEAILAALF